MNGTFGLKSIGSPFLPHPISVLRRFRELRALDVFFALNAILFLLMCVFAYYDRWVKFAGRGNGAIAEFTLYAVFLMIAIAALWVWLRKYTLPASLLCFIEFGIIAHFCGGLIHFHGARLYDHHFLWLRYDKYVHFTNALIAAFTVQEICRIKGQSINGFTCLFIFFTVLGLGAVVEICEFVATLTIPHNGVGGYDDTMGDLIANTCGGLFFLIVSRPTFKLNR